MNDAILAQYKVELNNLRIALDVAFGPGAKANPTTREDRVVFPLGVATRGLCEEIISFVHQGFGFAALRTARTLYECVVFSLYINKHPEVWEMYLNTLHAQWARVLRNFPDAENNLPDVHKAVSEKVPNYVKGKYVSLDWNDEGTTCKMAFDVGISELFHSLAFNYASGFVHPGAMFFLESLQMTSTGEIVVGVKSQIAEAKSALQIAHDMTINAIRIRLIYSDSVALRNSLAVCEKDFFRIWGYPPQLTKFEANELPAK